MTNSAKPARMKLAASVTMMSGTPDAVMITPVSVDSADGDRRARRRRGRGRLAKPWSSIHSADRQLANTIIAPTDRSMPPEMTMTPWAMARKASVIVPAVIVRISKPPNFGQLRDAPQQQTTSSTATPTVQPCRRARRDEPCSTARAAS